MIVKKNINFTKVEALNLVKLMFEDEPVWRITSLLENGIDPIQGAKGLKLQEARDRMKEKKALNDINVFQIVFDFAAAIEISEE